MGAGLLAAAGLTVLGRPHTVADTADPARREALLAYARAANALAREGGQVVVEEIKPRLNDLRLGGVSPEQFRLEAARWRGEFERLRRGFRALSTPGALRPAARLYDRALGQYLEAIAAFSSASGSPTDRRSDAIRAAIPRAEQADRTWDAAERAVDRVLRQYGLPTRPTIP